MLTMDLRAPSAKRRNVSVDHCIICFKTLNPKKEPVIQNPTLEGLNVIFKASELKKDEVYEALWPYNKPAKRPDSSYP